MIVIQETTVLGATKRAFLELLNHAGNTSDPAILREDSATITVTQPQATSLAFVIDKNKLSYRANYQHYFPRVDLSLIKAEEIDYTRLFLEDGGIRRIIELLHRHPDSRRNLLSSWDTAYLDPSVTGVCITQLYFRMRNRKLEVHSHARANDAYRLLLLDMQLAIAIQAEVARRLAVPVGVFTHFVDSLHFYKQYEQDIDQQRAYLLTAPQWSMA